MKPVATSSILKSARKAISVLSVLLLLGVSAFAQHPCDAHFTFTTDSSHINSIRFSSPTNAYGTNFYWNFGDGDTSDNANPLHSYAQGGTYWVCLYVSDTSYHCTDHWCDSVHVGGPFINPVCNARFEFYSSQTNADSIHFYQYNTGQSYRFVWTFGDGTGSTNPTPWHFYADSGTYIVCLTVTDSTIGGKCTDSHCDTIHIMGPPPPPPCSAMFVHYPSNNNPDSIHFYPTGNNQGNIKYYWSFGDGNYSDVFNPWHLYAPGNYVACLTIIDSTQYGVCTNTWCDSVHAPGPVRPMCNAQFQYYFANSNPDSVHFYTGNNSQSTKYYWTFGDGNSSTNADPWHWYSHQGTYYVCLTVTDSTNNGMCTDHWCDSVHVVGPHVPVCNARFAHYPINNNPDSIHFYPTGNNAVNAKYLWTFGDGDSSDAFNPWHLYAPGNYEACLTVTDSTNGGPCTDTWCDSVHVAAPPLPVCNAHFRYYSIQNPDSIHFYPATSANATTKYSWTFGDGTGSDEQYPWHFYTDTGTYTVCLTVTDSTAGGKCTDTQCDTIHIAPPPPPQCNAHFYQVAANSFNTIFHFNPAPNAPGTKYSWTFGDGDSSSYQDPTHTYTSNGTYYACLTVTDSTNNGVCTSSWCDSVHVGTQRIPCTANFKYQYAYTVNTLYFMSDPNAPGTKYSWNFGDGGSSNDQNVLHQFANPGTYWVCLTVNDSIGGCTATWCDSVQVGGGFPQICNSNFYFKPGNSVRSLYFFSSPNPPSTKYLWEFGDGDTSTQPFAYHQYGVPGTYRVCLTVTDTVAGCTDTRCLTIGPLRMANGGSTLDGAAGDAMATIYPNPITEYAILHIENTSGTVTFRMFDNLGRLVNSMSDLTNGDFDLNRQGLRAGLYLYEVTDSNNNVTRGKLIVQ